MGCTRVFWRARSRSGPMVLTPCGGKEYCASRTLCDSRSNRSGVLPSSRATLLQCFQAVATCSTSARAAASPWGDGRTSELQEPGGGGSPPFCMPISDLNTQKLLATSELLLLFGARRKPQLAFCLKPRRACRPASSPILKSNTLGTYQKASRMSSEQEAAPAQTARPSATNNNPAAALDLNPTGFVDDLHNSVRIWNILGSAGVVSALAGPQAHVRPPCIRSPPCRSKTSVRRASTRWKGETIRIDFFVRSLAVWGHLLAHPLLSSRTASQCHPLRPRPDAGADGGGAAGHRQSVPEPAHRAE
jgi:hypothetical protein